jgi:membrane protease YdiL (CAAX protease family)
LTVPDPAPGPETAPEPDPAARPVAEPAAAVLGLFRFSLEGRRTPALFLAGWLAAMVGGGVAVVGILAAGGGAAAPLFFGGLAVLAVGLILLAGAQSSERTTAGLAWAGPSPVLVFAACVAASLVMSVVVGAPLAALGVELAVPVRNLVAVTLQALVFLTVVHVTCVSTGALDARAIGLAVPGSVAMRELVAGAAWAVPVIFASAALAAVLVPLVGVAPDSPLPPTGSPGGLALNLLAGALIAPVAEEVVFRGVAVSAWARMAGPTAAIVRSSLLFALAHVLVIGADTFGEAAALAFVGAAARLPVAVALAWLYLRRGSLWAPIGLHVGFNAVLLVLAESALGGGLGQAG